MIGAITTPTSGQLSAGKFITDAPSRKGKLIYIDNPDAVHGKRQLREQDLSKPTGNPEHNFVLPGDTELPAGDRRRVLPKGRGPDNRPTRRGINGHLAQWLYVVDFMDCYRLLEGLSLKEPLYREEEHFLTSITTYSRSVLTRVCFAPGHF